MSWSTSRYNVICYGREDENVFHAQEGTARFHYSRVFDNHFDIYTSDALAQIYRNNLPALAALPTLIVAEAVAGGSSSTSACLSRIDNIRLDGKYLVYDFRHLPTEDFSSEELFGSPNFDWGQNENSRNHWAVKDGDLVAKLLEFLAQRRDRRRPKFFKVDQWPLATLKHVAVMMPFKPAFEPVYDAIKSACRDSKLEPLRVDEIYRPSKVMDDIHSTIVQSRVVISDLSGRNPNVLYETGIAHANNCDVIMVVQDEDDVPFDLRAFRYFPYEPDEQGLKSLGSDLRKSLKGFR